MAGNYLAKTPGTERIWKSPEQGSEKDDTKVTAIVDALGESSTKLCDLPTHVSPPMDGSSGSW